MHTCRRWEANNRIEGVWSDGRRRQSVEGWTLRGCGAMCVVCGCPVAGEASTEGTKFDVSDIKAASRGLCCFTALDEAAGVFDNRADHFREGPHDHLDATRDPQTFRLFHLIGINVVSPMDVCD